MLQDRDCRFVHIPFDLFRAEQFEGKKVVWEYFYRALERCFPLFPFVFLHTGSAPVVLRFGRWWNVLSENETRLCARRDCPLGLEHDVDGNYFFARVASDSRRLQLEKLRLLFEGLTGGVNPQRVFARLEAPEVEPARVVRKLL